MADLDRLKELDQTTYHAWELMVECCHMSEGSVVSDAWLQWCLQEAIATRGWYYSVGVDGNDSDSDTGTTMFGCRIWDCDKLDDAWSAESPAAALLAAYVAALEAQG